MSKNQMWNAIKRNAVARTFFPEGSPQRHAAWRMRTAFAGTLRRLLGESFSASCAENAGTEEGSKPVPVNYREHDISPESLERDATYSLSIGFGYRDQLRNLNISVTGKRILEIGPGVNFGSAMLLKCLGAAEVHLADAYLSPFSSPYHPLVYGKICEMLRAEQPDLPLAVFEQCITAGEHRAEGLFCHHCGLESVASLNDGACDVVFSNAVFEHLANPPAAFAELARIIAPGGVGFHQIDFREHTDYSRPLEFLLLPDEERRVFMEERLFQCGNGWRPCEYRKLFTDTGFEILGESPNILAEDAYLDDFMPRLAKSASRYASFPRQELAVVSALFVVKNRAERIAA